VHIVVSYFPGYLTCFVNGHLQCKTRDLQGDLSNWEPEYHLLLGNEWVGERPWHGRLDALAIYSRCIGADEAAAKYLLLSGDAYP